METRAANQEDTLEVASLARIFRDSFQSNHPFIDHDYLEDHLKYWTEMILPSSSCETYVCPSESPAAFISLCGEEIPALFVNPGAKRMGLGRALIERAKRERKRLIVKVFVENVDAVSFYRSQRFACIAPGKGHNGHEQHQMEWRVDT